MIKVMYGRKGTGKTKFLVDTANSLASEKSGDVVFIDFNNHLMYDLKHEIRFVNVSEFPVGGISSFLGFICGIISEDYDIKDIFIDGLTYIIKRECNSECSNILKDFFNGIKQISENYNINFYISMNSENDAVPEFIQEFVA